MQHRDFGALKFKVSALGFGCMRLPTTDRQRYSPHIDEAESIRMIRHAIDHGVNYLDTAYTYHEGQSERMLGRALQDGYRKRVRVATKLPVWLVRQAEDFDRILDEQLERLQTSQIDFYLFHALNRRFWEDSVQAYKLLDKAERALADGRIRHLGFSFHGEPELFEEILDATELWSFCQIQYNYMNVEYQAGERGLKLAADRGLGVVVMEPLLGGRLADPPSEVRERMAQFPLERTPVEWALNWLWNQPEVSVVLSGMSAMEQVEENLRLAAQAHLHCFGTKDQMLIKEVRACYSARRVIRCTHCGYCMPCPHGIDIPTNFELFNYAQSYCDLDSAQLRYQFLLTEEQRAGSCQHCGLCEERCPQQIPIADWMDKLSVALG
ncbi:aldo/keto reductase [Telmatobacter bradus]|uniref:aldo/keto reductase n=1 Tax=Telmatobacter bradus TaxID=474953 RepID=UPI003B4384A2